MMPKQTVYILGATGRTGGSILDALLADGDFTVVAGVRPSSASKPEVNELRSRGVDVRIVDLENWTVDQIGDSLKGVDTVISAIYPLHLELQKPLADACKKVSVKRFIPCDWGTACTPGVRTYFDEKLAIRDYIKQVGVGYTFVDVGWWMQLTPPCVESSKAEQHKYQTHRYGTGDVKFAVTDRRDIGKFVARIIIDKRTLNRYVFCWSEEVTLNEVLELVERVSEHKYEVIDVGADELFQKIQKAENQLERIGSEYRYSLWVRGDNTVKNAIKEEYGSALDARELYPELAKELRSLEDWAKEFYLT